MAFKHGRSGKFQLDDVGGTLRDLSAFISNVDFPRDVDAPETTTFSVTGGARTYVAGGLTGATFSITGFFDPTATTGPDVVISGSLGDASDVSFEYSPSGTATGDIQYTGQCIVTSYSVSSPVDGVVSFTADMQITGVVTRAVL